MLESLSTMLDTALRIPGTRIRFGADGILGLIPGIGDAITMAPLAYYIYLARKHRLPTSVVARMTANQSLDALLGAVPILGDAFDVFFKANRRNASILRSHLQRRVNEEENIIDV